MPQHTITEETVSPNHISPSARAEMFKLFRAYYDKVSRSIFYRDLAEKDLVILLHTADGRLAGFTTLSVHEASTGSQRIRYIFSGDTVMDSSHWGRGHLLRSWFRVAGAIKAQAPRRKLYWFLIVKGHRTYRILHDFFREYVPRAKGNQDASLMRLRDALAKRKFGDLFDPATGLVEFPVSRGQLAQRLQDAQSYISRPPVRDFLGLNPHYARGVELACVAELAESNMKSYAAIAFGKGFRA